MKKILAIIVMILMVMSLTVMAQAETRVTRFGEELVDGEYVKYVVIESDSGETAKLRVTDEEYENFLTEKFEAMKRAERKTKWDKFLDWVTFWN